MDLSFNGLKNMLGLGDAPVAPVSPATQGINDDSSGVLQDTSGIAKGVAANQAFSQDAYDLGIDQDQWNAMSPADQASEIQRAQSNGTARDAQSGYEDQQATADAAAAKAAYDQAHPGLLSTIGSKLSNAYKGGLSALGSPTGMAVLGGLAPVAAGILGNSQASGNRDASNAAAAAAIKAAGTSAQVSPSALSSYTDDPTLVAARQQALSGMQARAQSGLTPEDLIAMRQAQQKADATMQGQQSQINTDMARRGLNMSPAQAMVQQQQASQAIGAQQAAEADRITQQSRAVQLAALQNVGTMGQSAINSNFGQAQAKAQDTNAINKFNAEVLNNAGSRTTAAQQAEAARQLAAGQATATNTKGIGTGIGDIVAGVAKNANATAAPATTGVAPAAPAPAQTTIASNPGGINVNDLLSAAKGYFGV